MVKGRIDRDDDGVTQRNQPRRHRCGTCKAQDAGIQVIANAAESALEHHLGMTCDPVAGFVQVPCIERCAFGTVKAWTAYRIATNEIETKRRVDLDTCIAAMAMTAKEMNPRYKDTSEAGLVVLC